MMLDHWVSGSWYLEGSYNNWTDFDAIVCVKSFVLYACFLLFMRTVKRIYKSQSGAVTELRLSELLHCAYILYLVFSHSKWMPSFQIFMYLPSSVSYYLVLHNPRGWNSIVETPMNCFSSKFSDVRVCKCPVVKCRCPAQLPLLLI